MEQTVQLQGFRKTMKKYLQSAEVKDWMHIRRRKSVQMIHPAPPSSLKDPRVDDTKLVPYVHRHQCLPSQSVNLECHAFPRYRIQKAGNEKNLLVNRSSRQCQDRVMKPSRIKPTSSNKNVDHLHNEPEGSSELGRFRKRIEQTKTCRRSTTTVGCETLTSTRRRPSASTKGKPQSGQVGTECSSAVYRIRNLKCGYDGTTTLTNNLETRPDSMTLRKKLNSSTLMEEVQRQRAATAKKELRKRDQRLNAQTVKPPDSETATLRSSKQSSATNRNTNRNKSRAGPLENEDKQSTSCTTSPTRSYFQQGKRFGLEEEEDVYSGTKRPSYQIGSERANSRSMLVSTLPQKSRPLVAASRTTAILQDALEALECAHRCNEWGARTLHQLARASKAAVERNHLLLLDWPRTKPELPLPHDNDIKTSTHRGRVLESREEERVFIRDLVVASGFTNGDWVDKRLLVAKHQHVVQRPQDIWHKSRITAKQKNKKKLIDQHILYDFVEEVLRHELVLRTCGEPRTYLIHEHEHKGQALVQKIWNNLQSYNPSPAASEGTCTTEPLAVLQRDLKAQDPTMIEVTVVVRELEEMIYQSLVQELLAELKQVPGLTR